MTAVIYFGEIACAIVLAFVLMRSDASVSASAIGLFTIGAVGFTLAEYLTHRFVLHHIAPKQHGIHHALPKDPINKVFWQIWAGFAAIYLAAGGVVLAGVLFAYALYLLIHYCAHHNPTLLPHFLLKHHIDHHRFANRNFGVTTSLWDRVFGTMLRKERTR
jgi:sterol desaturase/sphingolipid hydroxylase (fatty acid hydroxylase superfamily)